MKTEEVSRLHALMQRARKEFENGFAALSEAERVVANCRMMDPTRNLLGTQLVDPASLFRQPIVDTTSMTITWGGRTCLLRCRLLIALMVVFSDHPNQYITFDRRRRDVWGGDMRSDETIRSNIRRLKGYLKRAGMAELADCIKSAGLRYGMIGLPET